MIVRLLVISVLCIGGVGLVSCSRSARLNSSTEMLARMKQKEEARECPRPPIEIFLQAEPKLNPNAKGQSLPVEVRVLLLKDRTLFDDLEFESLWQDPQESLRDDLVSSTSVTVYPGKLRIHPMKSSPAVAYVALVALFRQVEGSSWKYVVDVSDNNRRCADNDSLHTIVHAQLQQRSIGEPDPDAVSVPMGGK